MTDLAHGRHALRALLVREQHVRAQRLLRQRHLYEGTCVTTPRSFSFIRRIPIGQKMLVQNARRPSAAPPARGRRPRPAASASAPPQLQPALWCGCPPRVRSHCRFRHRGTEYVSESGIKWMSGSTKRQRDRAQCPPHGGGTGYTRWPRPGGPPERCRPCSDRRARRAAHARRSATGGRSLAFGRIVVSGIALSFQE